MPDGSLPAICHVPTGYCPRDGVICDRSPRLPVSGEFVLVRAEVREDLARERVALRCVHNGREREVPGRKIRDHHATRTGLFDLPGKDRGSVEYFLFEIGRFAAGDEVEYVIEAGTDAAKATCGPFRFTVDGVCSADTDATLYPTARGLVADFGPAGPHHPALELAFIGGRLHATCYLDGASIVDAVSGGDDAASYTFADQARGVKVEVRARPFTFVVRDPEGRVLLGSPPGGGFIGWRGTPSGAARSFDLRIESAAVHYFGFGERFDSLDQNGREPDICVANPYTRQGSRTYIPVPFFVTERGYGLYVRSDHYVRFGMAQRLPGTLSISAQADPNDPRLDLVLFFGRPRSVVREFTLFTGQPALPPKWAFGPWMSSNPWNTQSEAEEQVETTTRLDIPATVLVLEAWSDEATFYAFNDVLYDPKAGEHEFRLGDFTFPKDGRWPDPKGMIERLHTRDIRLVLWQIPVLKGFAKHENRQHEMDEAYAIERSYCVRNADGTPYRIPDGWFAGSLILDFTNPEARRWWFSRRRYLIDELGVDGFKTDGGEFVLDETVRFHDGSDGAAMRNRYPLSYIQAYHEFMGPGRITFSRSGFTGGQRFPTYWAGDQISTYDEFRAVLTAGLSLGLSGNPCWGFDIGGFSGDVPTADLFIRAFQMAAFSPIMQYHAESRGRENRDRTPWNVAARTGDERVVPIYRHYAWVRMNLLPYIYNEASHAATSGEPLMRALFLDFPDDPECYRLDDEYMFGRDILVAPVLTEHARERRLYLPGDGWLDFWTLDEVRCGWHERYPCDIDTVPVFVRKGAIIPLNLGDRFALGCPTGARGTAYNHLTFLVTGCLAEDWTFRDDEGNVLRFSPTDEGLRGTQVRGSLQDAYLLLLPTGDAGTTGDAGQPGDGRFIAWGGRGRRLRLLRLAEPQLRGVVDIALEPKQDMTP